MSPERDAAREQRIGQLIGAVARQALADRGLRRVALLDDGSAEAGLAARFLEAALPAGGLLRVAPGEAQLESLLHPAGADPNDERGRTEVRRFLARLVPDALPALPANKTALLLGGPLPPEPLLPLGDLYAGEVLALTGGWSAPAPVRELAERAGGIERLDTVLRRYFEARELRALESLPAPLRGELEAMLARGAASRLTPRIVPKLGYRTLCVDLFE